LQSACVLPAQAALAVPVHVAAAAATFKVKAQPAGQFLLWQVCAPSQEWDTQVQPFSTHVELVMAVSALARSQSVDVGPCFVASATAKVQPFACAQVAAVHVRAVHVRAVHVPGVSSSPQAASVAADESEHDATQAVSSVTVSSEHDETQLADAVTDASEHDPSKRQAASSLAVASLQA